MGRPSIFSSNYKQQLKRRKVNITLIILIIISAAYFGIKFYMNKNNIKISIFERKKTTQSAAPKVNTNKNKPAVKTNTKVNTNTLSSAQKSTYNYKTQDGKALKMEYTVNGSQKQFVAFDDESGTVSYDISSDKQYIVFDDRQSNDIILCDINGNFKKVTDPDYTSKSTGTTYEKDEILKSNPSYIWAAKPHFTNDKRIVYVSSLPYFKKAGQLFLWVMSIDGTGNRKVGQLNNNLSGIQYPGYDSEGNLRINVDGTNYYLKNGQYNLVQ